MENLTREAFWNVYRPGCTEHFVLNRYRNNPDFIPELDLVMEEDDKIIGHVMFSHASLTKADGSTMPAWTFGPISIAPDYKRKGYGLALLNHAIEKARTMGIGVLCVEGNIEFYRHAGFAEASTLGLHYHGTPDAEASFFLAQELIPGYLGGIEATYTPPKGYFVADEEKICGTDADGSTNFEYCKYCYNNGKFKPPYTMEGMIKHCLRFIDEVNRFMPKPLTVEEYSAMLHTILPTLKRWRNK